MAASIAASVAINPYVVFEIDGVHIEVPRRPLALGSLIVVPSIPKDYLQRTSTDISISYSLLQKIAAVWSQSGTSEHYATHQFLVYGRQHFESVPGSSESTPSPFQWEIVPFEKLLLGKLGSFFQQGHILKDIIFGGTAVTAESLETTREFYQLHIQDTLIIHQIFQTATQNDPFCNPERIAVQRVLKGEHVSVLFDYAPIGDLHFLFISNQHKETFPELSLEEYQEAEWLSQRLMAHVCSRRSIRDVHFFHKTGADAGQTVLHWHKHMIFTCSEAETLMGQLTVLKNMLFGSSPMKDDELGVRVNELKDTFRQDPDLLPYVTLKEEA